MTDSISHDHGDTPEGINSPFAPTDYVADARSRARKLLSGETHLGDVNDWRQSLVGARHAVMLVWIVWAAMQGFSPSLDVGPALLATGLGGAVYLGLAAAAATRARLRHMEHELRREREQIENNPDDEREEVRALYAAKGFREPLLTQIADTLCADDDRLLKVMMEEELGLFVHHINHPLLVGVWNTVAAAVATLLSAMPACLFPRSDLNYWMPVASGVLVIGLAAASARLTQRNVVPVVANWLAMGIVSGGISHYLAALCAGSD